MYIYWKVGTPVTPAAAVDTQALVTDFWQTHTTTHKYLIIISTHNTSWSSEYPYKEIDTYYVV